MYISHSVMEGPWASDIITPLTRVAFVYNSSKGLVDKTLGGSFKVVTLAPRTVREMIQLPKETQKNGDTNKSF